MDLTSPVEDEIEMNPMVEFEESQPISDKPVIMVQLGSQPAQVTRVGKMTNRVLRKEIERVLTNNAGFFAWSPTKMLGIDPNFMCHKLAILY